MQVKKPPLAKLNLSSRLSVGNGLGVPLEAKVEESLEQVSPADLTDPLARQIKRNSNQAVMKEQ